ncbi:MAG: hypothetical protein GY811_02235 [Myxococcales bacterium]|nr:hypothetical protein [Myxococcales bacterium]
MAIEMYRDTLDDIDPLKNTTTLEASSDGIEVGRTPLTVEVRQGKGSMGFLLRKTGFRNATVELPVSEDGLAKVVLKGRNTKPSSKSTEPAETDEKKAYPALNPGDFGGAGPDTPVEQVLHHAPYRR